MAIQWQDPDEEPMAAVPAPTPEFIAQLSHLGRGALDLWMFCWAKGDGFVATEAEIAQAMGRSHRWVAYASRLLREHGLLNRAHGEWHVCADGTFVPNAHERAGTNVRSSHERAKSDRTNVRSIQHERAKREAPLPPAPPSPVRHERENVTPPYSPPTIARFEEFFRRYPGHRRTNRDGALTVWVQGDCDQRAEEIGAGLDRWLASEDWADENGKYVPSAQKFLAEQRWLAAPRKPKPARGRRGPWVEGDDGKWRHEDNPNILMPTL